jgi:uncharacterized protein DUF2314
MIQVVRGLALSGIVFFTLGPGTAAGLTPCAIATEGDSPVARACAEGGTDLARKKMKELVSVGRSRGLKFGCDSCHKEDTNALTGNARDDFKKLLVANRVPLDRPVKVTSKDAEARFRQRIEPYVKQARATYPGAKRRYLAGLPSGEKFYVTTQLRNEDGRFEQIFILVQRIQARTITGRIASDIQVVQGYKRGDVHRVAENEILDWLIARRDGSEDGNFVGKFLDTQPQVQ